MHRLAGIIHRLFLLLYIIYAISPMVGDVDRPPANSLTAQRTSAVVKLFIVDRFLDSVFDVDNECTADTTGDDDAGDDFLVRKFRSLPGGNSLGKQMSSDSHSKSSELLEQQDIISLQIGSISHDLITTTVQEPFEGYGTLHSGPAPPSLLS